MRRGSSPMFERMKPVRKYMVAGSAALLLLGGEMTSRQISGPETSIESQAVSVVIRTDRGKYKQGDSVRLSVSLQNTGHSSVYVDRRMFWSGYGGGLQLVIEDDKGKPLPSRIFGDILMPPPEEGDASILVRLEKGFFYGRWFELGEEFPKPGRYSIHAIYKSWLHREHVAPHLRDLPGIWADTPAISSAPVWIEVTR